VALPLAGIVVLDLSRALAGPYCTALLADLGATIIKVESQKGGDITRAWPPFEGDHSLYFESINRGKSSLALDFYSAEGQQLLREMALNSDVIVENFRSGVMTEMGLDPDQLRAEKPSLVISSISGFGEVGPLASSAGLDQVAQAMSGLMSVTGPNASEFYRFGIPIIDIVSGIFSAVGIIAALYQRDGQRDGGGATGEGAIVSTSLLEAAIALSVFQGQRYLSLGSAPSPTGNDHPSLTPYGVYQASDGPLVIAVGNDKQWVQFCELLGAPELGTDERFVTGRARTDNRPALKAELERLLAARTAVAWTHLIREAGIPVGPIYTYDQVFDDEQVQALKMVVETTRADGSTLPLVRGPLSINHEPTPITKNPPVLGEDTDAVLASYGLTAKQIAELRAKGVVR
jgi:crotonobetainyl-CoA:carnitine CoA-transferase CaiB-like acyl-CoA transferase